MLISPSAHFQRRPQIPLYRQVLSTRPPEAPPRCSAGLCPTSTLLVSTIRSCHWQPWAMRRSNKHSASPFPCPGTSYTWCGWAPKRNCTRSWRWRAPQNSLTGTSSSSAIRVSLRVGFIFIEPCFDHSSLSSSSGQLDGLLERVHNRRGGPERDPPGAHQRVASFRE